MKSHTIHLTLNVPARMDFVNITDHVNEVVAASGVRGARRLLSTETCVKDGMAAALRNSHVQ